MIAKLIPTTIELCIKGKYKIIQAYTVIDPEGNELAPPMPKNTLKYYLSARQFCKQQSWSVEVLDN